MSDALIFEEVRKRYGRSGAWALDGMSFRVPKGAVCGFVGPNGAGKTTAFSVVSGFLPPDSGRVDLLGEGPFDPWRFKGRLGILPQDAELSDRHTPRELLVHLARLQGLSNGKAQEEAAQRLEEVRLHDRADARIASLSHGMRRRVAVASALLGSPELVLLDEPSSGLDPVQARSLRDLLRTLGGVQTLVVSSHNLLELEQICDWVVMVANGRCVRQGSVGEVTGAGEVVTWQLGPGGVPTQALTAALPTCRFVVDGQELEVVVPLTEDMDAVSVTIMGILAGAGVSLRGLRRGVSLEERFVRDTHGAQGG